MGDDRSRDDLLDLENDRWREFRTLLGDVPRSRAEEPILTAEGWSVRDLVWHVAAWNDVVTAQLQLMRTEDFDEAFAWNTEENNARFLEEGRQVSYDDALSALERSRNDVVRAVKQLDDVPPRALELFAEAAHAHLDDHLPELRRFLTAEPGA